MYAVWWEGKDNGLYLARFDTIEDAQRQLDEWRKDVKTSRAWMVGQ
jgi:hypothetical protein